jgi:hypothetical protein
MADNTVLNSGTGGDTIATDDIAGIKHQRVKIQYGVDGSATDVSDTNPLPIDDAGGSITVDNAGTFATQVTGTALTALELIDDVVYTDDGDWTALSSKHALMGGLYQSSPGTITNGDTGPARMNVNGALHVSIQEDAASIGGGTQYAVDAALGTTPTGTVLIAKRDDALSTLTPIEGDAVEARVNANGALWVKHDSDVTIADGGNSITVDNGGTFATQINGDALTALQLIDDAVHTDDAAFTLGTDKGIMMMGFAGTQLVNANDAAALACDTDGALHVSDGGNSLTVDGTVTANLSATDNAVLDQIEVNTSYGDRTGSGTEAGALRVTIATDSSGVLSVDDNGSTLSVDDGGGSITVDGTVTANAGSGTFTVDLGANNDIQGDVAHDAADSGNPIKIGAKVETSPKGITVATDGDRTDLYADSDGQLVVKVGTTGADLISERVSDTAGTSAAFTNFSAVASTYNYVTAITIANTSSTDGYVDFRDGAAGSVKWTVPIPANGGATVTCGGTPLFKTSANTALAYDVSAALSTVYISVSGYQSKV